MALALIYIKESSSQVEVQILGLRPARAHRSCFPRTCSRLESRSTRGAMDRRAGTVPQTVVTEIGTLPAPRQRRNQSSGALQQPFDPSPARGQDATPEGNPGREVANRARIHVPRTRRLGLAAPGHICTTPPSGERRMPKGVAGLRARLLLILLSRCAVFFFFFLLLRSGRQTLRPLLGRLARAADLLDVLCVKSVALLQPVFPLQVQDLREEALVVFALEFFCVEGCLEGGEVRRVSLWRAALDGR